MAALLLLAISIVVGFAPFPLSLHRPRAPPVTMIADPLFDPNLFDSASSAAVDFGVFGRCGAVGLLTYSTLMVVDPPSKRWAKRQAELRTQPDKAAANFGYLNADLSVPLPTMEELKDSCHRIGVKAGSTFYLCAQPSEKYACAQSESFSEYYGEHVYVCRQN